MSGYEASRSSNVSLSADMPPYVERRGVERKLAVLRVAKLASYRGEELCRIRNISEAGIMVETAGRHAVGGHVVVELRCDQRLGGTIVWARGQDMGIRFDQTVDVAQVLAKAPDENRRFVRRPRIMVACLARVRVGPKMLNVQVTDISQGGIKVAIGDLAPVGAKVTVTVDGLPSVAGVACWSRDGYTGIAFNQHFSFDQLTHWLGMRLGGCRVASDDEKNLNR
jgi:hypothetical protein